MLVSLTEIIAELKHQNTILLKQKNDLIDRNKHLKRDNKKLKEIINEIENDFLT